MPGPALDVDEEGVPYVFSRALQIYDFMAETSLDAGEDGLQVYTGRITQEIGQELGISLSQYSRSMKLLKEMQCVEQSHRSANGSDWRLYYRPTVQQMQEFWETNVSTAEDSDTQQRSARKPTKYNIIEQRINDLITEVSTLRDRVAVLEVRFDDDKSA